jgi:hypothetical protein
VRFIGVLSCCEEGVLQLKLYSPNDSEERGLGDERADIAWLRRDLGD